MVRLISTLLVALGLTLLIAMFVKEARSEGWPVDAMNEQIEKTNVIVGGVCSGTIIDIPNRLVLTAYHCITNQVIEEEIKRIDEKTGKITIEKVQRRNPLMISRNKIVNYEIVATSQHLVKIVGSDIETDIALLQVTDESFKPEMAVKLAPDSFLFRRGVRVYAVGNPGVEFDNSITEGIISAPQRTVQVGAKSYKFFQISASVIGGNSGGSVLDEKGQLVGTVSAALSKGAITFAVPISFTKAMIRKAGYSAILEAK